MARLSKSLILLLGALTCIFFLILPLATVKASPAFPVNATASFGGSISPSGIIAVSYGDNQTFNITPDRNYQIVAVYVNGTSIGAQSQVNVQNITGDTTIYATFNLIGLAGTPTPTPSPTPWITAVPTPTANPIATSQNTPTSTPNPTITPAPTPTIPEFPLLIIVPLLITMLSVAVIIKNRSRKFD